MPAVRMKSGARSQVKPSTKVMIALPDVFLEWCNEMATDRHLERNDVIRQSIGLGLLCMQAENMGLSGHPEYLDTKLDLRPLVKPSTKITIAFPDELLEWANTMATLRHMERNDVIREAGVLGLFGMVAENMRLSGRGDAVDAWFAERGYGPEQARQDSARVGGKKGFLKKIRAGMVADAEKASKQA